MAKITLFALIFLATISQSWSVGKTAYSGLVPLTTPEKEWGEVLVEIEDDELKSIDRNSFLKALKTGINQRLVSKIKKLPSKFHPAQSPIPLGFNVRELSLKAKIGVKDRSISSIDIFEEQKRENKEALIASPFGGAVNFQLERSWGSERLGRYGLNGQFNSFLNFNSFVFENQYYYQENTRPDWYRGDTRVVKDFEKNQLRVQAGDVHPQVQGFMSPQPMGGINVQKLFSLNPYRLPYPTGTKSFSLKARSFVKYFVNGSLVKSEYLPSGNYTISGIPLNNGLNTILIEATDDMGFKQIFSFSSTTNINLLNVGESRFDLSYGLPFTDMSLKRNYADEEDKLFSSFYQYGFSTDFSASLYLQNQRNFNLIGSEAIKATRMGSFSFGHAQSLESSIEGQAWSLNYQFMSQGMQWHQFKTLGLRYENRSNDFRSRINDSSSLIKDNYGINYSLPLLTRLTLSIGGNYGNVRDNLLNNRYGLDSTLNMRLFKNHNLALFVSRSRDENKIWNNTAHIFLTLNFPEKNSYVSTFYDQQQNNTRVTYMRDNQGKLHTPRTQFIGERSDLSQSGEVDMMYPSQYGNFGARVMGRQTDNDSDAIVRGSVRMHSALAFAYQGGDWGLGLTRPIPGSFVMFSPEGELRDQKLSLKSSSPFPEAEQGALGELTYSNLTAYQYREIQLDPTSMDDGRSLTLEKFVVYPTYRSAHLIKLKEKGRVSLRGKLLTKAGKPLTLKVGKIGETTFFTNRKGEFYIEGVEPGKHLLSLEDINNKIYVEINKKKRGLVNLGHVHL